MRLSDAIIHLRVPAATKGRWVRASRAARMRLTDWITRAVEAQMATIKIPAALDFSELRLARYPDTGDVSFDAAIIARIEVASGLPEGFFMGQPEDALAEVITTWYARHRANGGAPDPVAEGLLAEVRAEDAAGQAVSHKPSRA